MKFSNDKLENYISHMDHQVKVSFQFCDFENEQHCKIVAELTNQNISDQMGEGKQLNKLQQLRLVDGLATHPASFVLFACIDSVIVGMTICFVNFSTFNARSYISINNIIVLKAYRQLGIGSALLKKCINIAVERGCCKITLEVRDDNIAAQSLFKRMGFEECFPAMRSWAKSIDEGN